MEPKPKVNVLKDYHEVLVNRLRHRADLLQQVQILQPIDSVYLRELADEIDAAFHAMRIKLIGGDK